MNIPIDEKWRKKYQTMISNFINDLQLKTGYDKEYDDLDYQCNWYEEYSGEIKEFEEDLKQKTGFYKNK
jgi:uncharacterized protein YodC (DUF2158 family)